MKDFTFDTMEYVRPDYDKVKRIWEEATDKIRGAGNYEEVKAVMDTVDAASNHLMTMYSICSIRNTLNTTDEYYEKELEYNQNTYPTVMEAGVEYERSVLESPFAKDIEAEYGKELLVSMQRDVDSFNPALVPFMQKEAELTTRYQKLMATAQIPFRGEVYNLYGIQKFFEDPDRAARKEAFKAYSDFYHGNEEELEGIFSQLVEIRNDMGKAMGDENFIPLGYKAAGQKRLRPEGGGGFPRAGKGGDCPSV